VLGFAALIAAAAPAVAASPSEDQTALELPSLLASPFAGGTVIQALALRGIRPQVAALAMGGEQGGELAISAAAIPVPGRIDGDRVSVLLFVEIDGATLLDHDGERELARVDLYAYAVTPEGGVEGHLAQAIPVDVARLGDAIWQSGLKLYGELGLPPGQYQVRVLVRSFHSGVYGLRSLGVEVSQPGAPPSLVAVVPPPAQRDSWLPVRPWRPMDAPSAPYPFLLGERAVSPSALPVAVTGAAVDGFLFSPSFPRERLRLRGTLEPAKAAGVRPQAVSFELGEPASSPHSPLQALPFRFQAPELEPGDYTLRLALEDRSGAELGETYLPLLIVRGGWRERHLLWTDLRWLLDGEDLALLRQAPGTEGDLTSRRARREAERRRREDLSDGYRQVLAILGRGSSSAARGALVELERGVLGPDSRRELAALRATQLTVAESLVESRVESLLPLLALHDELYRSYSQRHLFSLAAHSRSLVERLAELYVENGGSLILGAHALASLGGSQQHANLHTTSQQLFRRALELDPDNRAALVGLAAGLEKHGQQREATVLLRRLVEAHPDFAEGRLRLALALRRQGDAAGAQELLDELWEAAAPGWIVALAAQELARMHLAAGASGRAVALLEEAIARAPGEPASYALLAHAYDH
jgi:tetratricopeptide (TPR) repeat protein